MTPNRFARLRISVGAEHSHEALGWLFSRPPIMKADSGIYAVAWNCVARLPLETEVTLPAFALRV